MATGVIGGTGLYRLNEAQPELSLCPYKHETRFGTVELQHGTCSGHEIYFLARHGVDHAIPPHRINYRANLLALYEVGCTHVLASNAVGTLCASMAPGDLVVPHDYIDFTRQRPQTFYDGGTSGVRHIDQTQAYSPCLRNLAIQVSTAVEATVHPRGVYVCTDGPRFETPAEIAMFAQLGADIVGMTTVPEVVLACELGMQYLTVCVVTNYAAGMSGQPLTEGEVTNMMKKRTGVVANIILAVIDQLPV